MSLTVLITGATAGFGEAMARRFVRDGHRVIAAGRRADRLEALARDLGDALLAFPLDVTERRGRCGAAGAALPQGWRDRRRASEQRRAGLGHGTRFPSQP